MSFTTGNNQSITGDEQWIESIFDFGRVTDDLESDGPIPQQDHKEKERAPEEEEATAPTVVPSNSGSSPISENRIRAPALKRQRNPDTNDREEGPSKRAHTDAAPQNIATTPQFTTEPHPTTPTVYKIEYTNGLPFPQAHTLGCSLGDCTYTTNCNMGTMNRHQRSKHHLEDMQALGNIPVWYSCSLPGALCACGLERLFPRVDALREHLLKVGEILDKHTDLNLEARKRRP